MNNMYGLGQTSTAPATTVSSVTTPSTIVEGLFSGLMLPVTVSGIGLLMAIFGSGPSRVVGVAAVAGGGLWFLWGVGQIH